MPFRQAGNQRRGRWIVFFFYFIKQQLSIQLGRGILGKTKRSRHDNTGASFFVDHATPRHVMEPASFFFIFSFFFFQHSKFIQRCLLAGSDRARAVQVSATEAGLHGIGLTLWRAEFSPAAHDAAVLLTVAVGTTSLVGVDGTLKPLARMLWTLAAHPVIDPLLLGPPPVPAPPVPAPPVGPAT